MWLGGAAPSELRRVGRLGDGWLPSFCTPADVDAGRPVIEAEAAAHGRTFDPEHWGALIPYLPEPGPLPDLLVAAVARRRPDADPAERRARRARRRCAAHLETFVAAGASKFVLVPVVEPATGPTTSPHSPRSLRRWRTDHPRSTGLNRTAGEPAPRRTTPSDDLTAE